MKLVVNISRITGVHHPSSITRHPHRCNDPEPASQRKQLLPLGGDFLVVGSEVVLGSKVAGPHKTN